MGSWSPEVSLERFLGERLAQWGHWFLSDGGAAEPAGPQGDRKGGDSD